MEDNENLGFAFGFFSDKNKTLQYFSEFRGFLLKSDKLLELKKLAEFYQRVQFLNKINLIRNDNQVIENSCDEKYYCELKCNLQTILELLISKHFKSLYQNDGADTSKEALLILETVAYLMNILQFNIQIDSFEILLDSLCSFFEKLQSKLDPNCHNVLQETDNVPLFYASLKVLVKILNYIHLQAKVEYLTESVVLRVIDVLPFPDGTTVKFFVANVFPIIIQISSLPLKEKIFTSLWKVITFHYKSSLKDGDSSVAASCAYNMLCCLSETIFSSHYHNVYLHDDRMFWDIVLSGVTSSYPFTRKRALNVFKIFLLWWNQRGLKNAINEPSVNSKCRDIKIWNDVVTLFECLEEKQVHVIKPVLPKFSRILLLIPNDGTIGKISKILELINLPSHETFDLGSAWVMALICRMLKHETKFVIRWCLSTLLTMDFITYPIHKYDIESFVKIVVEVFNEQTLYSRNSEQDNYSLFLSSEKISVFLKKLICTLETDELKGNFLRSLINHLASQSWSVVALLHVTLALSQLENFPAWNPEHLFNVQKIILDCQRSQEPTFRVALEWCMMECCSLFINWSTMDWEHLADFLMLFKSSTILHNTKPWIQFASRLSDVSTKGSSGSLAMDKVHLFCSKSIKNILSADEKLDGVDELRIERFSRLLIMIADSSVISSTCKESHEDSTLVSLLNPVLFTLKSAIERPYMSIHEFLSALKLITVLIRELSENSESNHSISILNFLAGERDLFQFMYNKAIGTALCAKSISLHSIIYEAFQTFSCKTELREILLKITIEMCHLLESSIVQNINILPIWRIINTIIYNICYTKNKSFKPESSSTFPVYELSDEDLKFITALNKTILLHILKNNLILDFLIKPIVEQENEKTEWLKFSHRMICDTWNIIFSITQHLKGKDLEDLAFPLVEEIKKTFNGGPKKAVPHSIRCLKHIMAVVGSKDMSMLYEILDCSWKACLEIRGNEAFRPALNSLIEVIFQKHMLCQSFSDILYNYLDKFEDLSENTSGIFCTVIKQFCKEFSISALLEAEFNLIPILRNALTYGPIHLKSHKIMEDTLIYLIEYDSNLASCFSIVDNNKPSSFVRIEVINYLSVSYSADLVTKDDFSFNLIVSLMQLEASSNDARSSQFANSFCHRLKNRAWQAIMFILPSIKSSSILEKVFMLTFDFIGSENQQPSIRYMQEWIIFYLCSHVDLLDTYISYFEKSLERRPSYIISIISILNLLILHQFLKEDKLIRCFKFVIVFSMAQNFTVRLYAQLALKNLCTLCKNLNIGKSILQYEFVTQVSEMQSAISDQGNFFKNVQKLSQDFYFSSFDPVNHFTLETLFYELPRLSNLCPDEWIKPSLFGNKNSYLEMYNNDEKLKNSISTTWANKPSTDNSVAENASLDFNFQKKIIPTKDIIGDLENLNLSDDKTDKEGLIVIASLIDRLPNLGGLCRTCEVFGVSEFVVGNIKFTEEKIFQNLAVSADKWVKTKEVKPHHLKDYLMSLKEEGYTLVGAEQTEDSHNLVEYKFPKKSALLLGHEKEGLPVDLIQLLDACVEIPQQGVIRSLNVHVSGAILIWEYARQNFTAPST